MAEFFPLYGTSKSIDASEPESKTVAVTTNESIIEVEDYDRDSLHTLPLSILPIQTKTLQTARFIKNSKLESMVETFRDKGTGSGQFEVEGLATNFGWDESEEHPDLFLLRKLAPLSSFDPYSLRLTLRENNIPIKDISVLQLSSDKTQQLNTYMTAFTRPLIDQIFGGKDSNINDFTDVMTLFKNPDIRQTRSKLKLMAQSLGIQMHEIPKFLEDYGDIFLSIAYYRNCVDEIKPTSEQFLESLEDIRGNYQLKSDTGLMDACNVLESTVSKTMGNMSKLLDNFTVSAGQFWETMSKTSFEHVEESVKSQQTTLGGILCGLTVKLDAYKEKFPSPDTGGPIKRAEFIRQEMRTGIDELRKIGSKSAKPPLKLVS
jgi:hypothetical protein